MSVIWEIGNENAGPCEVGWKINTKTNKDGQPEIITGQLYGQHFRVFADSMRAAATEMGAKIYIGAQVLHFDGTTSWNSVDRTWNAGVFSEVGDAADFYVMHNYFGTDANAQNLLTVASTEPKKNISFIQQDIANKNGFQKPVAITEYNINYNSANETMGRSYVNGMQATILFNEMIKNNFGLGARWLLASGEDAMFYLGDNNSLRWQPRPDFYYAYYQQKFTGDHAIAANSSNSNILAYASRFASGETGVVLVNRGKTDQSVKIDPRNIGVGNQYYNYSLTGGADNGDFSLYVSVNGVSLTGTQWGPRETLETIPANAYSIDEAIKLNVPARSVQFIMVEAGDNLLNPTAVASELKNELKLMNYPNPFSAKTTIQFHTPESETVSLFVFDQTGRKITTLVNETLPSGTHQFDFDGSSLPSGIYMFQLKVGNNTSFGKMSLLK